MTDNANELGMVGILCSPSVQYEVKELDFKKRKLRIEKA